MMVTDEDVRKRALTDLESTLLVEAAAGTGKTSILAGRATLLLAKAVQPRHIVTITFTELAASELAARIRRFVDDLTRDKIPDDLRSALPDRLADEQRANLRTAQGRLDELTATTIHGFCQGLIRGYAVEADTDPGARIMDKNETDVAFDRCFDRWLTRRLSGPSPTGDPIVALAHQNPRQFVKTLKELARFRLRHFTARTLAGDLDAQAEREFGASVDEFRRWLVGVQSEPKTQEYLEQLLELANFYAGAFEPRPDFSRLWQLAHPPWMSGLMVPDSFNFVQYRRLTAWKRLSGADEGERLNEVATRLFENARDAFGTLIGRVAATLIATLSAELDELLFEFAQLKRAAAVLDFDDLLHKARGLLREHEVVRSKLAERYPRILVDEFQDTDPVQAEILFLLATEGEPGTPWRHRQLRSGALFLVGDPKQAIYQFRGADIDSYMQARAAVERCFPGNVIKVGANFRSRPEILSHVNKCFEAPLDAPGQPGYVALEPTIGSAQHGIPCVARMTIELPRGANAEVIREAEADAISDLCTRLIGSFRVRSRDGATLLSPGHIALLAPTGTDLWRYERALEERGLPITSQAGKGLFRRQEIQDLIALVRLIADPRDTLAFGAFMRGPLVGLSEEEMLDIVAALPTDQAHGIPRFSVRTDPQLITHPIAREILSILRELRLRHRWTTPMLLISEAIERLAIRPVLADRHRGPANRALGNVDAFLELARPYGVRGLKRFARDLDEAWSDAEAEQEGRTDAEGDAIELITVHSSKGLEWPVVIPINTATRLRRRDPFVHRPSDDTLHWVLGDLVPPSLHDALQSQDAAASRERTRLWYVACTRAMELLILPYLTETPDRCWSRLVDLKRLTLPELDVSRFSASPFSPPESARNLQTRELFEAEHVQMQAASPPLKWHRPTDHDRLPVTSVAAIEPAEAPEVTPIPGQGLIRGLVLHKLMEEILAGELIEGLRDIEERAAALVEELTNGGHEDKRPLPNVAELAGTVLRTLALPEIAQIRPILVPEYPVYACEREVLTAGRVDAVAFDNGRALVVVDWKSDANPNAADRQLYLGQMKDYVDALAAERGAIVYMSRGEIQWVAHDC